MISDAEKGLLADRGLLRLRGVVDSEKLARTRDAILRICEREGFWRSGSWTPSGRLSAHRLRKRIKKSKALGDFMTPQVHHGILQFMNGRVVAPMFSKPQLLFSLPNGRGSKNELDWHIDIPMLGEPGIPGIQLFTFIDTVKPGGGGPVAVTGSHRLGGHRSVSSKALRSQLEETAFFRELYSRDPSQGSDILEAEGTVDGVELRVTELCGEPGDVYFMDVRLWHTRFPNISETARMMLTQRYLPDSVRRQLKGRYYG